MARLQIEYFSNALHRTTSFEMLIPNDFPAGIPWEKDVAHSRPMSTLFLLHGYTGKAGNWVPEGLPEKLKSPSARSTVSRWPSPVALPVSK